MIIGISGKMGSGKDTLAKYICEIDPQFQIKKFADRLKQICVILTGFHDQWTYAGKQTYLAEWGMTVGELQQKLGTEAIRNNIHQSAWIHALFYDYTPGDKWVITDLRFPNEAQAIKKRGGFIVRVDGTHTPDDCRNANHISEIALDNYMFDYRFNNITVPDTLEFEHLREHARQIYSIAYDT